MAAAPPPLLLRLAPRVLQMLCVFGSVVCFSYSFPSLDWCSFVGRAPVRTSTSSNSGLTEVCLYSFLNPDREGIQGGRGRWFHGFFSLFFSSGSSVAAACL
jgi:hypothetical protein